MNSIILSISIIVSLALSLSASAQELGPANQQIADKWMKSLDALPEHLSSRLMGEEVLYSGNLVSESEAEEILKADGTGLTQKTSELVNTKIYSSLQHQMKSKYLVDLIKAGKLEPRTYRVGSAEEISLIGVYLELHRRINPRPFEWGDVELHFDYSVLDRSDYLVNPRWDFGMYGPLTASAELQPNRVAYYVSEYLGQVEKNEIVFLNSISFASVRQVFVSSERTRTDLLNKIKVAKLTCPQAGGCAALIKAR